MAENVTPVVLKIKDFAPREVLLVNYKFNQATDQERSSVRNRSRRTNHHPCEGNERR